MMVHENSPQPHCYKLGVYNKAVNLDVFFVRCAHYKCAGYG
jgi:hypothetical protein